MRKVLLPMLAVAVLLGMSSAVLAQEAAAQTKTVAIVSLSGVGALQKDVNEIGELIGMPGMGEMLALKDPAGQPLIDPTKPIGIIVQATGPEFRGIAFVPAKNFPMLMQKAGGIAGQAGAKVTAPANPETGTWKITMEGAPVALFAKKQGDWAFLATDETLLARLPADPSKILGGLDKQYDFAIRAIIKNIPQATRDQAIAGLKMLAQLGAMQMGDDPNAAAAQQATQQTIKQVAEAINQLDELLIGLKADGGTVSLDLSATAVEGTKLANQFALVKMSTSRFAGFDLPGAAMTANSVGTLADTDVQRITQSLGQIRSTALTALRDEGLSDDELELATDLLNNILDVLQKTVDAKKIDGGMVVTLGVGKATMAAGGTIAEAAKLEQIVKQLAGIAAAEDKKIAKALKLDAETYQGIRFHVLPIPSPDDETAKVFGPTITVTMGIGTDSVYVGVGTDPVALVKQVIDKSKADAAKEILPFKLSVSLMPIIRKIASVDEQAKQMLGPLAAMLQGSAGKDRILVTSNPIPRGSLLRITLEEGVLKAIGAGVQMAGAAAGPGGRPDGPPPGMDPLE